MSAECNTCGFDIVYPEGTWPVGVCLNCKQGDEIEALRERVRRLEAVTAAARELDEWWGTWLKNQPVVQSRERLLRDLGNLRAALAVVDAPEPEGEARS